MCQLVCREVVYLKCFDREKPTKIDTVLPKPDGPLSSVMPMSSIESANVAVKKVMLTASCVTEDDEIDGCKHRATHQNFTSKDRLELGKRVGIKSTVRYFTTKSGEERTLSPSTLFAWKGKYLYELKQRHSDKDPSRNELPSKKRGRSLLLESELDKRVQLFLKQLHANGAVINTAIVMATAEGIVRNEDSNLLAKNGGTIVLSKHWARPLMTRINFVKRHGYSKSKVTCTNFEELREQFLFDIKTIIEFEEIPDDLILNWDHTGVNYIPVSSWTMAKEGSKKVEITGINDKRQIIVVLTITKTGHYLPPQLIMQAKPVSAFLKWHFRLDGASHTQKITGLTRLQH